MGRWCPSQIRMATSCLSHRGPTRSWGHYGIRCAPFSSARCARPGAQREGNSGWAMGRGRARVFAASPSWQGTALTSGAERLGGLVVPDHSPDNHMHLAAAVPGMEPPAPRGRSGSAERC